MRKSSFPWWFQVAFGIGTAAILAVGYWFYCLQKHQLRQNAENELTAIAQLKVAQIATWRKERLGNGFALAESPHFVAAVALWLDTGDEDARRTILQRFRNYQDNFGYADVLLVDSANHVRLSLSNNLDPLHETIIPLLNTAMREGHPVPTDLHLAPGTKLPPHIGIIVPLRKNTPDGTAQPLATVLLQSNACDFLYPLIQTWPTPSRTAETLLVRRDGETVLFLNNLRHRPDTAFGLSIPLDRQDVPEVMAVRGRKGVVQGHDYRGVDVLAAIRPVPGTNWFMVSEIDMNEAFAELRYRAVATLTIVLLLIAVMTTMLGMLWQRVQSDHFRAMAQSEATLRETEERHRITLMSIGDAVIATDADGRIELMNPVAEALTGWRHEDAVGHPLEEVFVIINEATRERMESPVRRVLREGVVVGLANHTLLVARDGTERPIADSGAPVRLSNHDIDGVVLVFRDQTAEYAAQQAIQETEIKYRDLFENMANGVAVHEIILDAAGRPVDYRFLSINPMFEHLTGLKGKDILGKTVLQVMPDTEPVWIERYGDVALTGKPAFFENFSRELGRHFEVTAFRSTPNHFTCIFTDVTERKKVEEQLRQSQKMESIGRLAGGVAHDFNNMLGVIIGYAELTMAQLPPDSPARGQLQHVLTASRRSADLTRQLLAFARKQTISPRTIDLNDTVTGMLKMLQRLIGEDIDLLWQPTAHPHPISMDPSQVDQVLANLMVNARDAIADAATTSGKITIETGNVEFDADYCRDHLDAIPGKYAMLAVSDNGCGMDKDTLSHLFEPFFTTKPIGQGTGLGLATVYGIVRQNHGFINAYSEPGRGTTFKLFLPRDETAAPETIATPTTEPTPRGTETVLLVEDEPALLELGRAMLVELGYAVLATTSPRQAIILVGEHAGTIHLLITDVVMPEMTGRDLWRQLLETRPDLKCLFVSGYTANVITHHGVLDRGVNFLQKPFSMDALAVQIRQALS